MAEATGRLVLITGGARSGKSAFAEALATRSGRAVTYVATLEPGDDEMRARIAAHRARRPAAWSTIEVRDSTDASDALDRAIAQASPADCVLIDCLAVWLADRLLALGDDDPCIEAVARLDVLLAEAVASLIGRAREREGPTIIVTNEVGDGVVPPSALGRAYRDLLGRANQQLSRAADEAWLLVAGRPIALPPPFER